VDLLSGLNSFFVKRINKFDLPTPESPIKTTLRRRRDKDKEVGG
jgi:hypothetical protein